MNAATPDTSARKHRALLAALALCALAGLLLALCACSGQGADAGSSRSARQDQASGAAFSPAPSITDARFDAGAAQSANGALLDTSHAADGYVGASVTSAARVKLQVTCGQRSENFNIPQDGTPAICPLPFGDGAYTIRIMQNTSGSNYVELLSAAQDVAMSSEFEPFIRPNIYCSFSDASACTAQARKLVADAQNQGQALEAVCTWIVDNIAYDADKAAQLKDATGYIPDPDAVLASKTGICFDYASLGAAMLRSQGIPTRIVTGTVSPDNVYHAWIMVHIDGTWKSAQFSVSPNTWSRVDLTFASSGSGANVGDGKEYADRYVY